MDLVLKNKARRFISGAVGVEIPLKVSAINLIMTDCDESQLVTINRWMQECDHSGEPRKTVIERILNYEFNSVNKQGAD